MVAHDCGQPFLYFCQGWYKESQSGNRVVSEEAVYLTTSGRKSGGLR